LAIWNIVGSNIFNTFFILWITSVIKPVDVPTTAQLDIWVNIIATILLFMFVFTWKRTFLWEKKNILSKTEWIILFSLYIVYLVYIVWVAMK
jgi:cation:H+ antiporter